MNELAPVQNNFQTYLLDDKREIVTHIVDDGRIDAATRLAIYADAYRLRLLEALETDFVALRALLGNETFDSMGRAYIAAYPSRHPSLRYFGRHMSEFLRTAIPYRDQPWLTELATFEWALTDAFDAADSAVIGVDDVATVAPTDWPQLMFVPHASVIRIDLEWNAPAFWKAVDQQQEAPSPERATVPIPWVIWRQDLQTYFRSLDVAEASALDAVLRGETFEAICEILCEWIDAMHVAAHAAGLLKRWVADGMISQIHLS